MGAGPAYFVDPKAGDDGNQGTKGSPWKTITRGVSTLKPGDTLYLRGGTYYENLNLTLSGTAEAPITIRAFPGEVPTIDGGYREFAFR